MLIYSKAWLSIRKWIHLHLIQCDERQNLVVALDKMEMDKMLYKQVMLTLNLETLQSWLILIQS